MATQALSKNSLKFLRGVAHGLNPVVMIADKGLSENVLHELQQALDHHELVKVKVRMAREERDALIQDIARQTGATLVQQIGHTATFYRNNPKKPVYELPR